MTVVEEDASASQLAPSHVDHEGARDEEAPGPAGEPTARSQHRRRLAQCDALDRRPWIFAEDVLDGDAHPLQDADPQARACPDPVGRDTGAMKIVDDDLGQRRFAGSVDAADRDAEAWAQRSPQPAGSGPGPHQLPPDARPEDDGQGRGVRPRGKAEGDPHHRVVCRKLLSLIRQRQEFEDLAESHFAASVCAAENSRHRLRWDADVEMDDGERVLPVHHEPATAPRTAHPREEAVERQPAGLLEPRSRYVLVEVHIDVPSTRPPTGRD